MSGISGFGTQLQRGDGATPEVFTTIANVTSISGPSFALDTIDVTAHDSANGIREFVAGLVDVGEISLDLNFDPSETTHTGLRDDLINRIARHFKLVFPVSPAVTWSFTALVTAFSLNEPMDDKLSGSVTLKISGLPTFS